MFMKLLNYLIGSWRYTIELPNGVIMRFTHKEDYEECIADFKDPNSSIFKLTGIPKTT